MLLNYNMSLLTSHSAGKCICHNQWPWTGLCAMHSGCCRAFLSFLSKGTNFESSCTFKKVGLVTPFTPIAYTLCVLQTKVVIIWLQGCTDLGSKGDKIAAFVWHWCQCMSYSTRNIPAMLAALRALWICWFRSMSLSYQTPWLTAVSWTVHTVPH